MAFDKTPSVWLGPGYDADAINNLISFTTAGDPTNKALPELTDAEAHVTTGDIRSIVHALGENLFQRFTAVPAIERPVRMTITKNVTAAANLTDLNVTYQINLTLTPSGLEVKDEPV